MTNRFLQRYGFVENPFESTNADDEPSLANYFIPPPYFPSILGDPRAPSSQIIFAPRGGGKSAQRRMIETQAKSDPTFVCVRYDSFDQPIGFKATDANLTYHLNQVCRLVILAILIELESNPEKSSDLSGYDKSLLKSQLDRFLGPLSTEQFQEAVSSIKTLGDKSRDFMQKYAGPIGVVLEVIKRKWGLDISIPEMDEPIQRESATVRFHVEQLIRILQTLGFQSCYVLVDKVDETSITGVADRTFDLIAPLLGDLPTLEIPGLAYKFFLWDAIEKNYDGSAFARRDRIRVYKLNWALEELRDMLARRMSAFSDEKTDSFNTLVDRGDMDVHSLITLLASGSPRNMIRLAQRIVSAATRTGDDIEKIPMTAVWEGVRVYSEELADEQFARYLSDLKRVGKPTFTIKYLGSDVFRVSTNAVRAKLQQWEGTGVVMRTGEIPNPGNRPLHLYSVVDPRVCIAAFHQGDPEMVLGNYAFVCHVCNVVCISDEKEFTCHQCNTGSDLSSAVSVLSYCSNAQQP